MDRTTWRTARDWVAHPVTCLAVLLLLLNDHVLKGAYGTWWTGKLSDVAGLVLAPPLLAVAAACTGRPVRAGRLVAVPVLVVGVGFVLAKATAVGADLASAAWSVVAGPSLVRQDATDLLALPALAVAALVGRRAAAGASRPEPEPARRPVPPRWLLALPLAVLATVATSAADVRSADVAKVVDGVAYVDGREGWYRSTDGLTWTPVDESADDTAADRPEDPPTQVLPDPWSEDVPSDDAPPAAPAPRAQDRDGDGWPDEVEEPAVVVVACTPAGSTCFRPVERGLGVERSDDGGRTWQPDWSVPADDLAALEARSGDVGVLGTRDVAVLPVTGGFRVLAANGGDGLAVRDVDGTWTRLDHVYEDPTATVVPLPGEDTVRPTYPVPEGVVVAVLAIGLVLLATGRSPVRSGTTRTVATAATGVSLAAFGAAVLAVVRVEAAAYPGHMRVVWYLVWVPPVVAALAAALSVAAGITAAAVSGRARAIAPAVVAGVAAGVAWELAPARPVAVTTALLATALGAGAARTWVRRAPRHEPEPPEYVWGPFPR